MGKQARADKQSVAPDAGGAVGGAELFLAAARPLPPQRKLGCIGVGAFCAVNGVKKTCCPQPPHARALPAINALQLCYFIEMDFLMPSREIVESNPANAILFKSKRRILMSNSGLINVY